MCTAAIFRGDSKEDLTLRSKIEVEEIKVYFSSIRAEKRKFTGDRAKIKNLKLCDLAEIQQPNFSTLIGCSRSSEPVSWILLVVRITWAGEP